MDSGLVTGEGRLGGASGLRVRLAAGTHPGRVRERNEDACGAFLPSAELPLPVDAALVVSDGVGGHAGGEEASRFTVDAVRDTLASLSSPPERPAELLDALLHGIHGELLRQAEARGMRGGMGATVTLALLQDEALFLAQVGDSRGYRLRGGILTQLTRDDSWVAEQQRLAPGSSGGGEPAFGRNVLTQCLGIGSSLKVQVVPGSVEEGDRYLLCSDGLHGPVSDAAIRDLLLGEAHPARAVQALLDAANAAGGPDNIAAVVFDVGTAFPGDAVPIPAPAAGRTLAGGGASGAAPRGRPADRSGTLLMGVGAALLLAGGAAGLRLGGTPAGDRAAVQVEAPAASTPAPEAPARTLPPGTPAPGTPASGIPTQGSMAPGQQTPGSGPDRLPGDPGAVPDTTLVSDPTVARDTGTAPETGTVVAPDTIAARAIPAPAGTTAPADPAARPDTLLRADTLPEAGRGASRDALEAEGTPAAVGTPAALVSPVAESTPVAESRRTPRGTPAARSTLTAGEATPGDNTSVPGSTSVGVDVLPTPPSGGLPTQE